MPLLSGDDIKRAQLPAPVPVGVPGFGDCFVRVLTARERDEFEQSLRPIDAQGNPTPNLDNLSARLVALCACDGEGRRLFIDDDAGQLGALPGTLIEPLAEAASAANGFSKRAREQAAKN